MKWMKSLFDTRPSQLLVHAESWEHALDAPGVPKINEPLPSKPFRVVSVHAQCYSPGVYSITYELERIRHYVMDANMNVRDLNAARLDELMPWEDYA